MMRRIQGLQAWLILVMVVACGNEKKSGSTASDIDEATLTYGYGPDPNGTARPLRPQGSYGIREREHRDA